LSGWIGLSPREVPCGFSARQGLHPLLQEPSSASLLPSNLREIGFLSRAPTGPRTPILRQPAAVTTRHWSRSEAWSPSAIRPRSRGWPILRNSEPPGPADRVKEASTASRILLRWRRVPEATAIRLLARQGSPPRGSSDPDAIVTTVARADYERLGSWTLELPRTAFAEPSDFELQPADVPANGPFSLRSDHWYVSAFSLAEIDGASLVSPGLEPSATTAVPGPHPQITVSYSLRRPWLPARPWVLTLRTEPSGAAVPRMVLVANERAVPL